MSKDNRATLGEFKAPSKDRFKPKPSRKGCPNCEPNHTLDAQLKGIVCKDDCHKYAGW